MHYSGEYGASGASYSFTSGVNGSIQVTVDSANKVGADTGNYFFWKNDAAACFDLRPYTAFSVKEK